MKVGSGGDLDLGRKYFKKLIGPMFYSWCNCALKIIIHTEILHE